jgi:hypothetical protein
MLETSRGRSGKKARRRGDFARTGGEPRRRSLATPSHQGRVDREAIGVGSALPLIRWVRPHPPRIFDARHPPLKGREGRLHRRASTKAKALSFPPKRESRGILHLLLDSRSRVPRVGNDTLECRSLPSPLAARGERSSEARVRGGTNL